MFIKIYVTAFVISLHFAINKNKSFVTITRLRCQIFLKSCQYLQCDERLFATIICNNINAFYML